MRAVLPGGRVALARTTCGPAQAHARGGPSHSHTGPAGAALLWIHVHLRDPTSVAHLLHVFAP